MRLAMLNTAGGVTSVTSPIMSAPIAPWTTLASRVSALTVCSCSTGSSTCTGNRTNMFDTWLVARPSVTSPWTDGGTLTTSGRSRCSPCDAR